MKVKYLDKEDIKVLLKQSAVLFVVADIGNKLNWITAEKSFQFWKEEIQEHVANNSEKIYLYRFSSDYAYIASLWKSNEEQTIILLEKIH